MHAYLATLCKLQKCKVHKIGGIEDHVHLFFSLPRVVDISTIAEYIKKKSSKWIKTKDDDYSLFSWQRGCGAFSVSCSQFQKVIDYIENQKEHHKTITFEDEYRKLLKSYNIPYDERYVWD